MELQQENLSRCFPLPFSSGSGRAHYDYITLSQSWHYGQLAVINEKNIHHFMDICLCSQRAPGAYKSARHI